MLAQPSPAQVYEDYLVPVFFFPFGRDLVARAAPQPGERVLDIGCGTGIVARLVAPFVGPTGTVTGIDPNTAMLAVARECAGAEGSDIRWHEGNATALPFADHSFDLVVSQQALQFVTDREAAAREMRRVLAPGGRALIATWSPMDTAPVAVALDTVAIAHIGVSGWAVPFSMGGPDALGALMRAAGFSEIAVESVAMTLRMPSYVEYVRQQILGAAAVVPSLAALSADEREGLVHAVEAELRPRIAEYLDGEALNYPMQTDIGIGR